jgi:hypothetical protein
MEVETDKATMEVPAGRDGVLAEIRAEAGREVPIGEVIAIIAADAAEAAAAAGDAAKAATAAKEAAAGEATDAAAAGSSASAQPQPTGTPAAAPAGTSGNGAKAAGGTAAPRLEVDGGRGSGAVSAAPGATLPKAAGGRVFASPKARRRAAERGVALGDLIAAGAAEPILVADLVRATARPASTTAAPPSPAATVSAEAAAATPQATAGAAATLTASAARSAFDALLAAAAPAPSRAAALAAFAAGALRAATGAASVTVACRELGGAPLTLTDPDRSGLTRLAHDPDAGAADLLLVDLSASRLTGYRPAGGGATLTATADGAERYMLTLAFDETALPLETAAAFLDDLARRVEDPIRHLL